MLTLLNTPLKSKIKANKKPFQYKIEMAKIKEMLCSLIIPIKILREFQSNFKFKATISRKTNSSQCEMKC